MPNKTSITFTEDEVRLAFIIGIAAGKPIDIIAAQIMSVTENVCPQKNKATGTFKPLDGSSKLATTLDLLRNAGYISACH